MCPGRSTRVVRAVPEPREILDQSGAGHLGARHFALDLALLEDQQAIAEIGQEFEILLDDQDGQALLLAEPREYAVDLLDDRRLDAFGRLVEEKHMRLGNEATGERQYLLLATRQLPSLAIEQGLEPRKIFQDRGDRLVLTAGIARIGEAQIVERRQVPGNMPRPCGT